MEKIRGRDYAAWLWQYTAPYAGRITLLLLLGLAQTFASLAMVQITKEIIDHATVGGGFGRLLAGYVLLLLGMQGISVLSALLSALVTERFSFGIRKQIYEKILHSGWREVTAYHTGDLMTRLTSDAGNVADGIVGTIPNIIQLEIELVLVFLMLFYYSPLLAVFALLVAPVAALCSWWLGKRLKCLQGKVQESESAYRSFLQESLANLLIVKAFTGEDRAVERLTRLREERFYWVYRKTGLGTASSTVMALAFQGGYLTAFSYGAWQLSRRQITYGTMSVFLTLVNRVQAPILGLAQQIPRIIALLTSAGRIMELQRIPGERRESGQLRGPEIGVELRNVCFGYTQEPVLSRVNFEIHPGEFAAIVGESGIGKTTLIRILLAFLEAGEGTVDFYNGIGERQETGAFVREFVAYVPQGNTLFSGTVRENLQMGREDATEQELWEALRQACGEKFVRALPRGLDTVIGERGHGLSEGQAQRIAIARAFLRRAPFLILDEATSALDEATELAVLQGLRALRPRPTCLLVTHRKGVLKYCDRELRIREGSVTEECSTITTCTA